ncbi:MAG: hypothetical protein R6V28_15495 [Nitriliruptoraceae bacterium]
MRELDWFDGPEQDPEGDRRRPARRWLLPLLAVPWLVIVALLVLPRDDGIDPSAEPAADVPAVPPGPAESASGGDDPAEPTAVAPPAAEAAPTEAAPAEVPPGSDAPPAGEPSSTMRPPAADGLPPAPGSPATVLQLEELRGRWRVGPGSEEAAALAIVIARSWLTGLGPRLGLPGAAPEPDTYAEHLVVEAVEHPSERTSVVTVLAVVLTDPDAEEVGVEVRRLAVPVATDQGAPRPAGAPWLLPGPALTPAEVELAPLDDPEAVDAATTALAVAGLGDLEVRGLATAEGWPVVATATDGERDHTIWLRRHLDGLVVAGSTLAGDREQAER